MSPEQLRGDEVDFRSDLYSLGIVIYELFTGALPFRGDTPVATIVRQLHDAPNLDLPALPAALRAVLARALAKDPADRYATAEEMRGLSRGRRRTGRRAHDGARVGPDAGRTTRRDPAGRSGTLRRALPILRMAAGQAAVAALAVHLVGAGGRPPAAAPSPRRRRPTRTHAGARAFVRSRPPVAPVAAHRRPARPPRADARSRLPVRRGSGRGPTPAPVARRTATPPASTTRTRWT